MRENIKSITEATVIPISLAITIVAAVWLAGHVAFQTEANARDVEELKKKQDAISLIQTDIAVIKTKVDNIEKSLK